MKMSEAYDRTKKLESMIADLQRGMNILMTTPMPNERAVITGLDISILALKEKKDELTEAVTALGNMEVVEPPTPPALATQQEERPEWAEPKGKDLVGVMCFFSDNGRDWTDIPQQCVGYQSETGIYHRKAQGVETTYTKWNHAISAKPVTRFPV